MRLETTTSSGVQEFIDRLQQEGVAKAQSEADELLAAARKQAMEIVDQAQTQAEEIVASAKQEAERTRANGEGAVRLAGRDAILGLTEELREDFERKLNRLVGHSLKDTEFLKQIILEVARKAVPQESECPQNILLLSTPRIGEETADSEQLDEEVLNQFVLSLGGEALRDGLTFDFADSETPGVRVQILDDKLEIDLTTESLTQLLLQHLSPRFRAIIQQQ